eukprot:scaffold1039_cov17-Prasinocladus_malaysianus.AAC.1
MTIVVGTKLLTNLSRFVAGVGPNDGAPRRNAAAKASMIFQKAVMLNLHGKVLGGKRSCASDRR